jgi:hypothetical protein
MKICRKNVIRRFVRHSIRCYANQRRLAACATALALIVSFSVEKISPADSCCESIVAIHRSQLSITPIEVAGYSTIPAPPWTSYCLDSPSVFHKFFATCPHNRLHHNMRNNYANINTTG